MESQIYNKEGVVVGKIDLPAKLFGERWYPDLVHQVIVLIQTNKRKNIAHTKDRSEVRGGGRKPWQQKGLGRARHGSIRSPIWIGGGVTHGPRREKIYKRKINKKIKKKALFSILSKKLKDNEILFVDSFDYKEPKTKKIQESINKFAKIKGFNKINYKKGNRVLFYTSKKDDNLIRMSKNIKSVAIDEVRNMNPYDTLNYKYLIISEPKESLKVLSKRV